MAPSDSDKTIFRQPEQSDHTIVRPTPGGGRRNVASSQPAPTMAPQAHVPNQEFSPQLSAQPTHFQTSHGLNPLVDSASVLITVFEKTRYSPKHSNVEGLYQRLVTEIKKFETHAAEQGVKPEIVMTARYLLCTALDEAVLNTPWGAESSWPQRTLLTTFHNETAGGEKFFLILDKLRASPMENLQILELIYLCLSLGFEGKYKLAHRGRDTLEQTRDDLFSIIRSYRGEYERSLSPHYRGLGRIKNSLASYIPMWVVAVSAGVLLLLAYSGFNYALHYSSAPMVQQLTDISNNNAMDQ